MIEELKYIADKDQDGNIYGTIPPSRTQIIAKINEIIQFLNDKEDKK